MERRKPFLTEEQLKEAMAYGESDVGENPVLYPPNTFSCDDPNHLKRTIGNGSSNHEIHLERVRNNGKGSEVVIEKPQDVHCKEGEFYIRRRKARKPR